MISLIRVTPGFVIAGDKKYRCAIGPNGLSQRTTEGSRTTPIGEFALRKGFYRWDKLNLLFHPHPAVATFPPQEGEGAQRADGGKGFPLTPLNPDDGWCDAPSHPLYNQRVKLPFAASHEELWRADDTYDIIIPIGYNDEPVVPGKGSAIFFHITRPDYSPTLGCVAISLSDMLEILPQITTGTRMKIG